MYLRFSDLTILLNLHWNTNSFIACCYCRLLCGFPYPFYCNSGLLSVGHVICFITYPILRSQRELQCKNKVDRHYNIYAALNIDYQNVGTHWSRLCIIMSFKCNSNTHLAQRRKIHHSREICFLLSPQIIDIIDQIRVSCLSQTHHKME